MDTLPNVAMTGLRNILIAGGGYLVGEGLLTNDELTTIVSGIVTAAAVGWSLWVSHKKAVALKDAKEGK